MTPLERHSEPFAITGGIAAEGVRNQLGRPDIHPIEVLVREAVQNAWDARRPDSPSVHVEIGRRVLTDSEAVFLREQVLVDPPPGVALEQALMPGVEILHFADWGTTGLGGHTEGNRSREESSDFADFVFISGAPPDKLLGGGSFGFGKTAFFTTSAAGTIVVDTLCLHEGAPERRLICCALGESFADDRGLLHTGRHWWGRVVEGAPKPLFGDEAASVARGLGLPVREGHGGLGTTVAIVAPDAVPDDGVPTPVPMPFIVECLLWDFWPKMLGDEPAMGFTVVDGGQSLPIRPPMRHPRLRPFVEAMMALRDQEDGDERSDDPLTSVHSIDMRNPRRRLGRLAVQRAVAGPTPSPDGPEPLGAALTRSGLHHIALMRNAELVVRYLPGREPVAGRHGYAGVFKCGLDVDQAFRSSEPPTHDDWIVKAVPAPSDRRVVSVALRRIGEICRDLAGAAGGEGAMGTHTDIPLGEFADAMASLMPGFGGAGARIAASRRPGAVGTGDGGTGGDRGESETGGRQRADAAVLQDPRLVVDEVLGAAVECRFEVLPVSGPQLLEARVEVMTGDGNSREADPPAGWEATQLRHWISPDGRRSDSALLTVDSDDPPGTWTVRVPAPPDAMVRIELLTRSAT